MPSGICHLCDPKRITEVEFCSMCNHWFCDDCRRRYWARGLAAVKQMIGRKRKGCCGIMEG